MHPSVCVCVRVCVHQPSPPSFFASLPLPCPLLLLQVIEEKLRKLELEKKEEDKTEEKKEEATAAPEK